MKTATKMSLHHFEDAIPVYECYEDVYFSCRISYTEAIERLESSNASFETKVQVGYYHY